MTQEVNKGADAPIVEDNTQQLSSVEQEALDQGWVPKEEFQGDPAKWVEAGEFIRRGELFSKIDTQNRYIKNLEKSVEALRDHYSKVKETEYNRALSDLKRQIKIANREGDFERADALEAHIENVEKEAESFKREVKQIPVAVEEQVHPEFAAWVNKNPWYVNKPYMRDYAEQVGKAIRQSGVLDPQEVLSKVTEAVKKEFPNQFTNPKRSAPSSVEGGGKPTGGTTKDSFVMNEQEVKIMNNLINQKGKDGKPLITKEQYIADLKRVKGVA